MAPPLTCSGVPLRLSCLQHETQPRLFPTRHLIRSCSYPTHFLDCTLNPDHRSAPAVVTTFWPFPGIPAQHSAGCPSGAFYLWTLPVRSPPYETLCAGLTHELVTPGLLHSGWESFRWLFFFFSWLSPLGSSQYLGRHWRETLNSWQCSFIFFN